MSLEKYKNPENKEIKKERLFSELYEEILAKKDGDYIDYRASFPKKDFLAYLLSQKDVLLHGSNNNNIQELEPRQANCISKELGNMKGVYSVDDPVLPMFYAIKDKHKFRGFAVSGIDNNQEGDAPKKNYIFKVSKEAYDAKPWSEGVVYILPRESFKQVADDDGELTNEWFSIEPVKPLAKLKINPQDFPYLDKIQPLDDKEELELNNLRIK